MGASPEQAAAQALALGLKDMAAAKDMDLIGAISSGSCPTTAYVELREVSPVTGRIPACRHAVPVYIATGMRSVHATGEVASGFTGTPVCPRPACCVVLSPQDGVNAALERLRFIVGVVLMLRWAILFLIVAC